MKLDVLAFGVHPDDVELSCAGTLLKSIATGKKVGIIDLTQGELGTRGTAFTRLAEAKNAAQIMGVAVRENLMMADGFFLNDKEHQLKIIEKIRQYQPDIILCNALEDRHPDHGRAASLVADACFLAGLRKIETRLEGIGQLAYRPKLLLHYIQDRYLEPNFVMDITGYFDKKMESILCYATQFFNPNLKEPETYISTPAFLEGIKAKDQMMGKKIGVLYGEGFISKKTLGLDNLSQLVLTEL